MNDKMRLFRADGDRISVADFVGSAGRTKLETIGGLVVSARVMKGNPRHAAVKFNRSHNVLKGLRNNVVDALKVLMDNIPSAWLKDNQDWSWTNNGMHDDEIKLKFNDAKVCSALVNRLNASKALCNKVRANDVTTVDPAYSGAGAELSITMGNQTVTFMRPFDQTAATARQNNTLRQAAADKAAADAQQQQAEADLVAEEARNATTMGRTLRIVGICALAALVIGLVTFVIVKTKKK